MCQNWELEHGCRVSQAHQAIKLPALCAGVTVFELGLASG